MRPLHIFCLLLLLVAAWPARAQESGLSFLRVGIDASAMAMGDAHVAVSRDAFATYWNPAGLAAATSNSAALSHHIWIGDVRTYALATRFQAGQRGGLGLFITATGSGDLEAREGPTAEPDGFFDAQFISAGAAYGRRLGPLRAGLTVKYLSERIYTNEANGYAFDAGLQVDLLGDVLRLGVAVQNIGEMSELSNVATPLPRLFRGGVALFPLRILMEDDGTSLLNTFVTAEISYLFPEEVDAAEALEPEGADPLTQLHLGVAAEVLELVTVRVGYVTNDALRSFSLGGGLGYGAFLVDYAFLPFESGFGGPGHVLTLRYAW